MSLSNEDNYLSYLPFTHSMEQSVFSVSMVTGLKFGFYQGDPLKLVEDCAALQPTLFVSVPRLYNRIYAKIQAGFAAATGCKAWLLNSALNAKTTGLSANPAQANYTNGCYDKLVFSKVAALLGGKVRYMISGSAPIDGQVLDFLKIAFCCPVLEAYGLTETSGGCSGTVPADPVSGHIGNPIECAKWRLRSLPDMEYLVTDKPYPRGELCIKGTNVF